MCHIQSAEVLKRAVSNMAVVRFTDRLVPGSFTRCERCTRESKFNNWPTAVQWIRFRRPVTVLPPLQLNTLWLWKLRFLFHRHKFSFSTFENVSERLSCQNIVCVTLYFKALSRSSFEVKIRLLSSFHLIIRKAFTTIVVLFTLLWMCFFHCWEPSFYFTANVTPFK